MRNGPSVLYESGCVLTGELGTSDGGGNGDTGCVVSKNVSAVPSQIPAPCVRLKLFRLSDASLQIAAGTNVWPMCDS